MKPETTIAQKAPYSVDVEAGKTYWWCACGRSARQPFCDGSHKGSSITPAHLVHLCEHEGAPQADTKEQHQRKQPCSPAQP